MQVYKRLKEQMQVQNGRRFREKKKDITLTEFKGKLEYAVLETEGLKINTKNSEDSFVVIEKRVIMKVERIKKAIDSESLFLSGPTANLDDLESFYVIESPLCSSKDVGEFCHLNSIDPFKSIETFLFNSGAVQKVWYFKNELITGYSTLLHLTDSYSSEVVNQ